VGKRKTADSQTYPDFGEALGDGLELPKDLQAQLVAQMRLRESNIPPKYMGKTLESFKTHGNKKRKELLDLAEMYINGFSDKDKTKHLGLMFVAPTGAGKTHLATSILKGVIRKGYSGVYCNVPRMLEMMRELMFDRANYDDGGFLARCETCDLLALDDLGGETVSGWVQDRLYLLINRRYENVGRTIVTTNCDEKTLRERIGERVESRLSEMCKERPVFPAEDYRMRFLGPK
jgi:DNA replication protein DnaC